MKKPNPRRVILGVMAGLCMYIAFERIRQFYTINFPIGEEMSCFDITIADALNLKIERHLQMRLIVNSWEEKKSLVMLKYLPDGNVMWSDSFTFEEQRMLNPKKMDCQ